MTLHMLHEPNSIKTWLRSTPKLKTSGWTKLGKKIPLTLAVPQSFLCGKEI
jgi:hypothetical protein